MPVAILLRASASAGRCAARSSGSPGSSSSSSLAAAFRRHAASAGPIVAARYSARFQSSAPTTPAPAASASGCPHAAAASQQLKKDHSTLAADAAAAGCPVHTKRSSSGSNNNDQPELVEVPSLPFFGSLLRPHSKIPALNKPYAFWPTMRALHGDFYTLGLPGLGNPDCPKHTLYVVQCPHEMNKVVRSEGSMPSGLAQGQWAIRRWEKDAGFETVSHEDGGFLGRGDNWKRLRAFMQSDLLHPTAAKGYAGGIIEAAELASKGAPASADDLNAYFERCAFDMFSTVMFGHLMEVADPNTPTDGEDAQFVRAAKVGLGTAVAVSRSLMDSILVNRLGIETAQYRKMKDALDSAWRIGSIKIERFVRRREKGELTEREKNSYLHRALERYEGGESGVTLKEVKEMAWGGIFAAVDTTSGKMGWNVLQAALNPSVQERLYAEISQAAELNGGRLSPEALLGKGSAPYLHAFVRETHRLTPVSTLATRKRVASDDLHVHGVHLPLGSAVMMEGYSLGQDPNLVDEPRAFRPERWLPVAVAARKGTPKEVLDHPYLKDPFSQGPRKCPGSRVALNEVAVMLSQLVLDYEISTPPGVESLEDVEYSQQTVLEPKLPELRFEPRRA